MAAALMRSICLAGASKHSLPVWARSVATCSVSRASTSTVTRSTPVKSNNAGNQEIEILLEPKFDAASIRPGHEPWTKRVSTHSNPYRPVLEKDPVSIRQAVEQVRSQDRHYAIVQLYQRKYIVSPGDIITLPHVRGLSVGFKLELEQVTEVGSRDYTIRGAPYLDPNDFIRVNAIVCEVAKGLVETKVRFKRRKRYQKVVQAQHTYSRIRVGQFQWSVDSKHSTLE